MRIEDHKSGCVAYMCMGEWVGCGCCLVRLNVAFRKISNTWKLLWFDGLCQPHGRVFRENSGLGAMGVRKLSRNANFLLE